MTDRDWPEPTAQGMVAVDATAPWLSYHYPYTDAEAAALGCAVIDASCLLCHTTERVTIDLAADPADDEYPPSGISIQRSEYTMRHLHGRRTLG